MRRRLLAIGLLVVLAGLAGCSTVFGPGDPDPEDLRQNASYDWGADANVSVLVNKSSYEAVYRISEGSEQANTSELQVYQRDVLGQEEHVPVSSPQFRYPNGTRVTVDAIHYSNGTRRTVNETGLSVSQTRQRTILDLPNDTEGSVAFTAARQGKRFSTPVFVEGSYAVTLPPNARVGVPVLSQVSPGSDGSDVTGDRMTIRWDDVTTRSLTVRWYLERDLLLFAGIVVVAVVVGSGGALYYYRQIRQLERRRDEADIDVTDEDDDFRDDGPPPGMR